MGKLVKYVGETCYHLTHGKTYEVLSEDKQKGVRLRGDEHYLLWFRSELFVPADEQIGPLKNGAEGRKDDSGKLDLTLLIDDLPHALEGVAEVLQCAVTKKQPKPYERGSWQGVEDFQRRYRAAVLRHMLNAAKSAKMTENEFESARDQETGLLELAHIATGALFMLEMAMREEKQK